MEGNTPHARELSKNVWPQLAICVCNWRVEGVLLDV